MPAQKISSKTEPARVNDVFYHIIETYILFEN